MAWRYFDFECSCGCTFKDMLVKPDETPVCPECGNVMLKLPVATNTYSIEGDNGASIKPRKRKNP